MLTHSCRGVSAMLCEIPASLLPWLLFLANYRPPPHRFPEIRASDGRSKKEDLAVAPKYAALAPRLETGCLRRVPELRRAQASASSVRIVRILRRARGDRAAIGDGLTKKPRRRGSAR